jgi:Fe-S-cluster containining protein
MTERLDAHRLCMRGTWADQPRCAALEGEIGRAVACTVYPRRPDACREVQPGDAQCAKARARRGLAPLEGLACATDVAATVRATANCPAA